MKKSYQKIPRGERAHHVDELSLVRRAFECLKEYDNIKVACNIPVLGRCVDLAYMKDDSVITVEFKLRDWRRAIKQAKDHRLAADYAYVCMPRRKEYRNLLLSLRAAGVGLIFFNEGNPWPFDIIETAPKSSETWPTARENLGEYLESKDGNWLATESK